MMNNKLKTKNKINFNTKIGGKMKIKLDFMHVYLFCFIFDLSPNFGQIKGFGVIIMVL